MRNLLKAFILLFVFYAGIMIFNNFKSFSFEKTDLKSILEKIILCSETINYWGIKETESHHDNKMYRTKYETIYIAPYKVWLKYIEPERFSGRQIVLKDRKFYSKDKNKDKFSIGRGRYPIFDFNIRKENIELLMKNYNVVFHKNETIANRKNIVFEVMSKNCKKPHVKVWMDNETGLIMKFEMYFGDEKLFGYWLDDIKINPSINTSIFDLVIEDSPKRKSPTPMSYFEIRSIEKEVDFPVIKSKEIAYGYVFRQGQIVIRERNKVVHLLYTDGLNNISVFVKGLSKDGKEDLDEGEIKIKSERGRTVINKRENNVYLSLIGGLEKEDMMKIFFSLK